MRKIILYNLIFLAIISCKSKVDEEVLKISDIEFPLIMDFQTSDSLTNLALSMVKQELNKKKEPMDSMFITANEYDTLQNLVIFRITHFDSFLLKKKLEIQDSLNGYNMLRVPPTGNWSGHDRTMIYRVCDKELDDIIDQ